MKASLFIFLSLWGSCSITKKLLEGSHTIDGFNFHHSTQIFRHVNEIGRIIFIKIIGASLTYLETSLLF